MDTRLFGHKEIDGCLCLQARFFATDKFGKFPIKWRQCPDIVIITVDWDVKRRVQSILFKHVQVGNDQEKALAKKKVPLQKRGEKI